MLTQTTGPGAEIDPNRLRQVLLAGMTDPDCAYGREFPRIGWYPDDDSGILTDVLQDMCDTVPIGLIYWAPELSKWFNLRDAYKEGRISAAVARARWRVWFDQIWEDLLSSLMPRDALSFDEAFDNEEWMDDVVDFIYSANTDGWLYTSGTGSATFMRVMDEMPRDVDLTAICTAALRLDPNLFLCLVDWEGAFVYASPKVEGCSLPEKESGFRPETIGYGPGSGDLPTFVLPDDIIKACLEQARAAESRYP
jgi:hypothetical protein